MSYTVQEEQRVKMRNKLQANPSIDFKELTEITDAFQIASGQSYAIGKTKALLDFLKNGYCITVLNFGDTNASKVLKSRKDLVEIFKSIDPYIDLDEAFNFF